MKALPESPASERNKAPILEHLATLLPADGHVLEVASGLGQHVVHFAGHLPASRWQPTEADPELLAVVRARVSSAGLDNVHEPVLLDVLAPDWSRATAALGRVDAIYAANLFHIAAWAVTDAVVRAAPMLLAPRGRLIVYGPFRVGGRHVSSGNAAFDLSLRERNPDWGIRDLELVLDAAAEAGFSRNQVIEMPANNRLVVFER